MKWQKVTRKRKSWYCGNGKECSMCGEENTYEDLIELNDDEYFPDLCANYLIRALNMLGVRVAFEVGQEKVD